VEAHVATRSPVTACTFPTASCTGEEEILPPGELARREWITPALGVCTRGKSVSVAEASSGLPSGNSNVRPASPPAAAPCASSLSPSASSANSVRMILSRGLPSGGPASASLCGDASSVAAVVGGRCGALVAVEAAGASPSSTAAYASTGSVSQLGGLAALAVVGVRGAYLLRPAPCLCGSLRVLGEHAAAASQPRRPNMQLVWLVALGRSEPASRASAAASAAGAAAGRAR